MRGKSIRKIMDTKLCSCTICCTNLRGPNCPALCHLPRQRPKPTGCQQSLQPQISVCHAGTTPQINTCCCNFTCCCVTSSFDCYTTV